MTRRATGGGRTSPIEFWFDFSSAYGYLASIGIDALGARVGRPVLWRPFMLGPAFRATGSRSLSSTPLKGEYALRDWRRIARLLSVPFDPPADHPHIALAATRAFHWLEAHLPDTAPEFARSALRAYYAGRLDTASPEAVAAHAAASVGADPGTLLRGIADEAIRQSVRDRSDEALARGIFGSPFFIVDGEPFWGWDRMEMMERWIEAGGW